MNLVISETPFVCITVRHFHLTLQTHVIFPEASENRTIGPNHLTFTLSLSSHEIAVIISLFKFRAVTAGQALKVFNCAVTVWSAVFEISAVLVSVFKIDNSKTKKIKL